MGIAGNRLSHLCSTICGCEHEIAGALKAEALSMSCACGPFLFVVVSLVGWRPLRLRVHS